MKKITPVLVIISVIVAGGLVALGVKFVSDHYLNDQSSKNKPQIVDCAGKKLITHDAIFKNNQLQPMHIKANACDKLTIINKDPTIREVAFGPHEHHQAYDGVVTKFLSQGQSLTVTLDQIGNYTFHDHIHDQLIGYFTVER